MKKLKLPPLTKPLTRTPKPKGFAVMRPADVKRIATQGGKAVAAQRGSEWLARIGSKGGKNSHRRTNGKAREEA